jgi:hypothetical protein
MRLALLVLAAVAAVVLWRRGRTEVSGVVVEWPDGAEIELSAGTREHEQLVAVAEEALA